MSPSGIGHPRRAAAENELLAPLRARPDRDRTRRAQAVGWMWLVLLALLLATVLVASVFYLVNAVR